MKVKDLKVIANKSLGAMATKKENGGGRGAP